MPNSRNRYPFETMLSGQSFAIAGEDESKKVRNAAYQFQRKVNKARAEAITAAAGDADKLAAIPDEVRFVLRKTDEVPVLAEDGSAVTADGKPVVTKHYRLWRS